MDYAQESKTFRAQHSTRERTADARLGVDPGFVHHRKIQALLPPKAMGAINVLLTGIPADAPDFVRRLRTDHASVSAIAASTGSSLSASSPAIPFDLEVRVTTDL